MISVLVGGLLMYRDRVIKRRNSLIKLEFLNKADHKIFILWYNHQLAHFYDNQGTHHGSTDPTDTPELSDALKRTRRRRWWHRSSSLVGHDDDDDGKDMTRWSKRNKVDFLHQGSVHYYPLPLNLWLMKNQLLPKFCIWWTLVFVVASLVSAKLSKDKEAARL